MVRHWSADPIVGRAVQYVRTELQTLTFHSWCFLIKTPVEIISLANIQHTIQDLCRKAVKSRPADFCTLALLC